MALPCSCKCENPKLLTNNYTGKDIFVACGKCISCRRARQSAWVARMQKESKCHLYEFEIQLDYNEKSLPKYDFSSDGSSLIEVTPRLDRYYKKFPHLKTIDLKDLKFNSDADYNYFVDRLNSHWTCIPHSSVYDVQLFKKRLNRYIQREVTGQYSNFRSVFVSELGGDTFRPHVHGILYFDDKRIAENLDRLVRKAWRCDIYGTLGHARAYPSRGKLSSYIAKYITVPTDLPSFYEHPALRNFFLTSRRPPIGGLLESSAQIRKIFFDASPQKVEFVKQGELWCPSVSPIGQNIENRLFPKCLAYSQIDSFAKSVLYKIAVPVKGFVPPYKSWFNYLYYQVFQGDTLLNVQKQVPHLDLFDAVSWALSNKTISFKPSYLGILIKSVTREFETERSLKTLYGVSSRVFWQSKVFGVDMDFYISQIMKYHDYNKPQSTLSKFYNVQNEVFKSYETDYRFFYPLSHLKENFDPSKSPDSVAYHSDIQHKFKESLKNKEASDYRNKKLRFTDPVLCNIIDNYYAEKCNENAQTSSYTW